MNLVVGGDGLIGKAVLARLCAAGLPAVATTRRAIPDDKWAWLRLDLTEPASELPAADVAYLCAGIKGFRECEGVAETWRVNVDGMVAVGKQLLRQGAFVVYVSTDAVDWSPSSYARQRAQVEAVLQGCGDPAIVRCGRVTSETAPGLAAVLIEIGTQRRAGVHRWNA